MMLALQCTIFFLLTTYASIIGANSFRDDDIEGRYDDEEVPRYRDYLLKPFRHFRRHDNEFPRYREHSKRSKAYDNDFPRYRVHSKRSKAYVNDFQRYRDVKAPNCILTKGDGKGNSEERIDDDDNTIKTSADCINACWQRSLATNSEINGVTVRKADGGCWCEKNMYDIVDTDSTKYETCLFTPCPQRSIRYSTSSIMIAKTGITSWEKCSEECRKYDNCARWSLDGRTCYVLGKDQKKKSKWDHGGPTSGVRYCTAATTTKAVHPCDLNNGGCADTCKKEGETAVCACTKPDTRLGTDGKSCERIIGQVSSTGSRDRPYCSWRGIGKCNWNADTKQKCANELCKRAGYGAGVFVSATNNMCISSGVDKAVWLYIYNTKELRLEGGKGQRNWLEAGITAKCASPS